jgi:hypothetical protein
MNGIDICPYLIPQNGHAGDFMRRKSGMMNMYARSFGYGNAIFITIKNAKWFFIHQASAAD